MNFFPNKIFFKEYLLSYGKFHPRKRSDLKFFLSPIFERQSAVLRAF